jgi:hypothetical protein
MITVGPAAPPPPVATDVPGEEVPEPLGVDLLLEHPEMPAARIAAPATATVNPRFTCAPYPIVAVPALRAVKAVCGFALPRKRGVGEKFSRAAKSAARLFAQ